MKYILYTLSLAVLVAGCSDEPSAARKQAIEVHNEVVRLSGELHDGLVAKLAETADEVQAAFAAGDTALAVQLQQVEAKLSAIDLRFHEFSGTVAEVPGYEHDHSGHDHSGHDHSGHDHAGHDHGGPSLEGMTDEAILEIQQALKSSVEAIKADFEAIDGAGE